MSVQAEQLLRQYNQWRRRTANFQEHAASHAMRDLAQTTKTENRVEIFDNLIAWCNSEGIDPERWLYTLFSCRRWRYTPMLNQLIPKNPKTSKAYKLYFKERETTEYDRVARTRIEASQEARGQRFDPNRDLSAPAEHLKRQYLADSQPQACMNDMERTFGYHPKSVACARCQLQGVCANKLQSMVSFNILALRRGDITADQAYAVGKLDVTR